MKAEGAAASYRGSEQSEGLEVSSLNLFLKSDWLIPMFVIH